MMPSEKSCDAIPKQPVDISTPSIPKSVLKEREQWERQMRQDKEQERRQPKKQRYGFTPTYGMMGALVLLQLLALVATHFGFLSTSLPPEQQIQSYGHYRGSGPTTKKRPTTKREHIASESVRRNHQISPPDDKDYNHYQQLYQVNQTMLEIPESEWQKEFSPRANLLKVYVYDDKHVHPNFTAKVEDTQTAKIVQNPAEELDFRAEMVIFKLFRTYPGRTYDPKEADLFVIPYPHFFHCLQNVGYRYQCGTRDYHPTVDQLMNSLIFAHSAKSRNQRRSRPDLKPIFDQELLKRHLFVAGVDDGLIHPRIVRQHLHLSLGPMSKFTGERPEVRPGDTIMPYVNDRPEFQPTVLRKYRDDSWWTRDRYYSLVYFYGASNGKMRNGNGGFGTSSQLNCSKHQRKKGTQLPWVGSRI